MKESCPDIIVGAGTVTTREHIDAAIAAGGQFIVTPGFDPELVTYAIFWLNGFILGPPYGCLPM